MVEKHILCPERLRRVPRQFSWVDQRLVRDRHVCGLSHQSLALYLFLVTVSDADGLSYYSDAALGRYLELDAFMVGQARAELCKAALIAYRKPLYQILSLEPGTYRTPPVPQEAPTRRGRSEMTSVGNVLRQAFGGI